MPRPPIVSRIWSNRLFQPGKYAREIYEVAGVPDDTSAISAANVSPGAGHIQDARLIIPEIGGISCENVGPTMFRVTAEYSLNTIEEVGGPLDQPADIYVDFVRQPAVAEREKDGNPITNSARIPPSQAISTSVNSLFFRIAQYESSFDFEKVATYTLPKPTLNSDSIDIPQIGALQPRQLLIDHVTLEKPIKAKRALSASESIVRVIYHCEARGYYLLGGGKTVSGFCHRILDKGRDGTYRKDGSSSVTLGPIVVQNDDEKWVRVADDALLDGHGFPLHYPDVRVVSDSASQADYADPPAGSTIEVTPSGVFLYYQEHVELPVSGIGFKFL